MSCGCIRSKGEEKISKILTENNIIFKREYSPKDFVFDKSGRSTYFDFAIFDSNYNLLYLIEY